MRAHEGCSESIQPYWIPTHTHTYEGCLESIWPFWISQEPVKWPWYDLAARQRGHYCVSVNSHSPVGLVQSAVRCRWLSLCTVWPSHSPISSLSIPILTLGKTRSHRKPNQGCRGADRPGWCDALPKKKACTRAVQWAGALLRWSWSARLVIVNATVTQYTSLANGVSLPTD